MAQRFEKAAPSGTELAVVPVRYVHFIFSLSPVHALMLERMSIFPNGRYEYDDWAAAILSIIVDSVLYQQAMGMEHESDLHGQAISELEAIGFTKQNAHEVWHETFNAVADCITAIVPNFGDERYRENYEYKMRNRLDLHIAVAEAVFT